MIDVSRDGGKSASPKAAMKGRAFLLFFVLTIVFFSPCLIGGKVFIGADVLNVFYPWKFFSSEHFRPHNPVISDPTLLYYAESYNRDLKAGRISLWNPYVFTGSPSHQSYYPLKLLLHALLPAHAALNLLLAVHVLLMGCFMYMYIMEISGSLNGSLFGAVAYMFNGCIMVWLEFEGWVYAGAYLPLLLFCLERCLVKRRRPYAAAGAVVFGLTILAGHKQLIIYAGMMAVIYFIFILLRLRNSPKPAREFAYAASGFAFVMVVGCLIGSIELVPFLELASESGRASHSYAFNELFTRLGRVPLHYLSTLVFPDFYGNPVDDLDAIPKLPTQAYMNYNELCMYGGVPALFAFVACLAVRKDPFSRFHLLMIFLVAAMMTGTYAYYPVYRLVPGMDRMNPIRIIFLFTFLFSVCAGLGIRGIEDELDRSRRLYLLAVFSLVILAIFAVIFRFQTDGKGTLPWLLDEDYSHLTWQVLYRPAFISLAAYLIISAMIMSRAERVRSIAFYGLLGLLCFDLITFGRRYNTTVHSSETLPETPAIEFLKRQPGTFRVLQADEGAQFPNALAIVGLEEAAGYSSLVPGRFAALSSYIQSGDVLTATDKIWKAGGMSNRRFMPANLSSPLIDLLNVRFVALPPGQHITDPGYVLVYRHDLAIYENTRVMPRVFAVHRHVLQKGLREVLLYMGSGSYAMADEVVLEEEQPQEFLRHVRTPAHPSTTHIVAREHDKMRMTADMSANGWLVLSDTYFPGWKAFVDGKQVPILRANCNFRALRLSEGRHDIVFSYEPGSLRVGSALSLLGIVACISQTLISAGLKKKGRDDGPRCQVG